MNTPRFWLEDYVLPILDTDALAERLAMTGTEVERVTHHGVSGLEHFVVGKVLATEQHPDADRLKVCTVDVGEDDPKQIVCGAPNVAAGQTVGVARPGSIMPDGTKLKKAKLRGVESDGMILAEDEVGLGSDHAGIMVLDQMLLDAELAPGAPLAEFLPISSDVLELEITPNRPDCLGIYGVAREVHAATGAELKPPPWAHDPGSEGNVAGADVVVEVGELCPRFTARVFEDVTIAPSPLWLKARLLAAGQRPINNVVDITNYVMLVTGQPTHAFDLDHVAGGKLTVRRARDGEKMTTLDDVERTLSPEMVVIEDGEGPTSIAGIMGGQRSEVSETTTRLLFEAATWNGPNVNKTMQKLALRSEAGSRFEKQLQPEQAMDAQALATKLLVEVCGATYAGGTIDVGGPGPDAAVIRMRDVKVTGLLGLEVARETSRTTLEALGFGVADADDGLDVTVPYWRRTDVTREADVIEEIARLVVLDALPSTLPENRTGLPGRLTHEQRLRRRAQDALTGTGLTEAVGWSFTGPAAAARLGLPEGVRIENPMSEDQSQLRRSLIGSLLAAAELNAARGNGSRGLWENGMTYVPRAEANWPPVPRRDGAIGHAAGRAGADTLPAEFDVLAALLPGDVFAAKGHLEAVATALRVEIEVTSAEGAPWLHPGRAAHVAVGGELIGWLGELHPRVAAEFDLTGTWAGFELDLDRFIAAAPEVERYEDVTSFPALRLDIAVVVDAGVPAGEVVKVVRGAGGARLIDAHVFDVYTGTQIAEGRKSLAVALTFRASDRTLSDEDVLPAREKIVRKLGEQLGGELRG